MPAMEMGHREHEAETEARAWNIALAAAVELPRHDLALALRNAGAKVANLEPEQALGQPHQAERYLASPRRIFDRIVEEIADGLGQKIGISLHNRGLKSAGV